MLISELLLEKEVASKRRRAVDTGVAVHAIKNECSDALEQARSGLALYRGTKEPHPGLFYRYSSEDTNRSSSAVYPYYGKALETLDAWKKLPRRQIFCSTEKSIADFYTYTRKEKEEPVQTGVIFVVFPKNGTKMGLCPTSDIQTSFHMFQEAGFKKLTQFNQACKSIFQDQLNIGQTGFMQSAKSIHLSDFEDLKLKGADAKYQESLVNLFYTTGEEVLYDVLEKALDPDNNGIKVVSTKNALPANREIWFDGRSINVVVKDTPQLEELCKYLKLDTDLFSV